MLGTSRADLHWMLLGKDGTLLPRWALQLSVLFVEQLHEISSCNVIRHSLVLFLVMHSVSSLSFLPSLLLYPQLLKSLPAVLCFMGEAPTLRSVLPCIGLMYGYNSSALEKLLEK